MSDCDKIKNDRLLRAIRRAPVDRTPVWIMRQAGRYLPEYRAIRAKAKSFLTLCKTPELACEVTLQPIARYPLLDAAIIFSDILTIPDAMGLGLAFKEGEGPFFHRPVQTEQAIKRLAIPDPELELPYVLSAIRMVKHELASAIPLIGFCGSPFTLAAYMVQGKSSPGFPALMTMLKQAPLLLHQLLAILADSIAKHLLAQIAAGVNVVMIFDTWGGLLTDNALYQAFSLQYMRQIIEQVKQESKSPIPIILFTKGGSAFLTAQAESGCDVIGIDWEISLQQARAQVSDKVALQGNLHPESLLQAPTKIKQMVRDVLASYGLGHGHIFNLGHGITPNIPPENVAVMLEAIAEYSPSYKN
jgi:uroporphyrinogen decarboxylase